MIRRPPRSTLFPTRRSSDLHLGGQVSQVGVQRLLGRLERGGRGLLPTLTRELAEREDLLSAASRDLVTKGLGEALRSARRWADELFAHLARRTESETPLRLTEAFAEDPVWAEGLGVALDNLLVAFDRLRDGVETVADRLALDDPTERNAQIVGELR